MIALNTLETPEEMTQGVSKNPQTKWNSTTPKIQDREKEGRGRGNIIQADGIRAKQINYMDTDKKYKKGNSMLSIKCQMVFIRM